jgi:hypothetical protein
MKRNFFVFEGEEGRIFVFKRRTGIWLQEGMCQRNSFRIRFWEERRNYTARPLCQWFVMVGAE